MTTAETLDTELHRAELLGYCYRFLGSYAEAEDAVQETMLRAWQHADGFERRASLRSWLYRIATNVCTDMTRAPQRRSLPMDLTAAGRVPDDPATMVILDTRPDTAWIGPIADAHLSATGDPAESSTRRESIRLAFITALQVLPATQRAVLILRDVLAFSAQECAELLDTSVASVNSALARARTTMREHDRGTGTPTPDAENDRLLRAYLAAFESYDVQRLVDLMADDARFSMPPFELWLSGVEEIERWWRGPGAVCRGSRTIPTRANGQPALAVYHPVGENRFEPFAIHVLDVAGGEISAITHFMGAPVFAEFGLPDHLTDS